MIRNHMWSNHIDKNSILKIHKFFNKELSDVVTFHLFIKIGSFLFWCERAYMDFFAANPGDHQNYPCRIPYHFHVTFSSILWHTHFYYWEHCVKQSETTTLFMVFMWIYIVLIFFTMYLSFYHQRSNWLSGHYITLASLLGNKFTLTIKRNNNV